MLNLSREKLTFLNKDIFLRYLIKNFKIQKISAKFFLKKWLNFFEFV